MHRSQRNLVAKLLAISVLVLGMTYLEASESSCVECEIGIAILEGACGDGSTIEFTCEAAEGGCNFDGWC